MLKILRNKILRKLRKIIFNILFNMEEDYWMILITKRKFDFYSLNVIFMYFIYF
jgi:hypothetical protein